MKFCSTVFVQTINLNVNFFTVVKRKKTSQSSSPYKGKREREDEIKTRILSIAIGLEKTSRLRETGYRPSNLVRT